MILTIALASAIAGFLAGMLSFKKTNQFCDRHGVTRLCPICGPASAPAAQQDTAQHDGGQKQYAARRQQPQRNAVAGLL